MDPYLIKRKSPPTDDATPAPPRKKLQTTPSGIAHPSRNIFDPWNSSSTGHQHAAHRLSGSTSWRDSRNLKLKSQYRGGLTGGKRVADTVGAGSENFGKDGRKENGGWVKGASGLRDKTQKSLWEVVGTDRRSDVDHEHTLGDNTQEYPLNDTDDTPPSFQSSNLQLDEDESRGEIPQKQIFRSLCIYINGSTAPVVSDHKLKYLLNEHGASTSCALGRRSVTHVIIGKTHGDGGTGGGLAGSKIQKEITKVRGKGIKFVSVEWVLESIKAGKRLSEARFECLKLGGNGQQSVYGAFKSTKAVSPAPGSQKG